MKKKLPLLPERGVSRYLEPAGAAAVLIFVGYAMWHLTRYHYLPQPFFYDPLDTFMDWINTSWWARNSGTYDQWNTIYPPLSSVFMKIFGIDRCYESDVIFARDCDWLAIATLFFFYLLDVVLISLTFLKIDRRTAVPRSIALSAGLPVLFALDRGQLLIVCFTFFILAFGPLLKSARLRWISAAITVNFKPYLIAAIFPQLLRRRWLWFEGAIIGVVCVYIITYGLLGRGTPVEIIDNLFNFTGTFQAANFLDVWYAATVTPLTALFTSTTAPVALLAGSTPSEFWAPVLTGALRVVQLSIAAACVAAWLRPDVVPMFRLTNFGVSFALITAESGGYTQMLIIFLVLMERWRGAGRGYAITICYLLCIPADYVFASVNPLPRDSYLGGRLAFIDYGISLGPFLRPVLIMSLPFALSCVTIRDVWTDIRTQGWTWRRRFRRDLPLLTGPRPQPAAAAAAA